MLHTISRPIYTNNFQWGGFTVYQCRLLISLANSSDQDQTRQITGPDQGSSDGIPEIFFQKNNF